jgi:protein phosphatase
VDTSNAAASTCRPLAWSLLLAQTTSVTENTSAATDRQKAQVRLPRPFSSLVHVDINALTHTGHRRPNNEDQFFVAKATRALETLMTSLPPGDVPERADELNYVMVVADGMGGHAAGEVASRLTISALVASALQIPDWILRADPGHADEIERRARETVQQVGSMLVERGRQDPSLRGMGSTLTAARSYGRELLIVHVGDSRAYLLRSGHLQRLTRDHTYAQMMVDAGLCSPDDVTVSGVRHILTNVLGGAIDEVDVDVDLLPLENGDRLLLCSDGLTDCVDDETIGTTLQRALSSREACARLVQLALDGGGQDNVTVLVASFEFPTPTSE